jgi:hypothetical protein
LLIVDLDRLTFGRFRDQPLVLFVVPHATLINATAFYMVAAVLEGTILFPGFPYGHGEIKAFEALWYE